MVQMVGKIKQYLAIIRRCCHLLDNKYSLQEMKWFLTIIVDQKRLPLEINF
jgi:hypothetical protein